MIEAIVDRLVIRDDDPREPHASESWMKIRAVAVAISPGLLALGVLTSIDAPESLTWVVPILFVYLAVKSIGQVVNDRIEELEKRSVVAETE